jgi:hypothetical protein
MAAYCLNSDIATALNISGSQDNTWLTSLATSASAWVGDQANVCARG